MSKINNKNSTIKRVLLQIRPYLPTIILLLALAVVSVLCSLYIPVLVGDAIDAIIGKEQVNFAVILPKLFTCAVLIGCAALAQWLMNVCGNKVTYNTIRDMREAAFKKIHRLPFSYLDAHETGDIVSRIIADVDQFADGLLMGFSQLFTGVVTIIGTIGFMLSVNVWTTLVVVLVTPLSILVARFIAKKTFAMFRLQSETRGRQTAFINEMITNQKVVRAYGHEDENMEKFDTINEELRRHTLKATFFSSITNPATRFVNSVVYAAVALIGAFLAVTGQGFTIGMLSCFLSYANQYTKPFNEISGVITELQNALACADRLLEFLDSEEMSADPELLPEHSETAKGQVTFDNVCFSYTKDRPLIRNFSLDVPAGCRVAIVGPTGCGKTTMLRDIIRQISDGESPYPGLTVGVVDERSEIAGCYLGVAQNDVGIRTDVLDCCPKAEGMMMLIRAMSPDVVAVDEIGTGEDIRAIESVVNCGCKLLATVHGNSMEDMKQKPLLNRLVESHVFERYIVLDAKPHAGSVQAIFDGRGTTLYRREAFL